MAQAIGGQDQPEISSLFAALAPASIVLAMAPSRDDQGDSSIREIGRRIGAAAGLKKIPTNQLDVATGQSKGQTSRLVNGRRVRSIDPDVLPKYAKALGVSFLWLYKGVGDMHADDHGIATTLEADLRAATQINEADNIDVAWRYHRRTVAPEVVERVRAEALAAGVDIDSRHPDQWAIVLGREQRKANVEHKRNEQTARKLLLPAKKRAS